MMAVEGAGKLQPDGGGWDLVRAQGERRDRHGNRGNALRKVSPVPQVPVQELDDSWFVEPYRPAAQLVHPDRWLWSVYMPVGQTLQLDCLF